jgi:hypothetical protein
MQIEQEVYTLFVLKYKVDVISFEEDFVRFIHKNGHAKQALVKFYTEQFDRIIVSYKQSLPKDQYYSYIITSFYKLFIKFLNNQGIESSKYLKALRRFERNNPEIIIDEASNHSYPVLLNKQYNLSTNYGRRKAREQAFYNYQNGSPEYRSEYKNIEAITWVILIFIAFTITLLKIACK